MRFRWIGFFLLFFLFPSLLFALQRTVTGYVGKGVCYTDSLTAASTASDTLYAAGGVQGAQTIAFSIEVVLNGSTGVTLQFLGGQKATKLGNLDTTGSSISITADGVYTFLCPAVAELGYFAIAFISEAGGTGAVLRITAKVG